MKTALAQTPSLTRVLIKPRHAGPALGRHPWVFADAIEAVEGTPADGDVVGIYKSEDSSFIAWGLYNSRSQIRIRLYSWNESDEVGSSDFWRIRVAEALSLRLNVLGFSRHDSFRAIFSESDELSGLTVDKFGDYLVMQISSLAIFEGREVFVQLLQEALNPRAIKIKTDRSVMEREGLEKHESWVGTPPEQGFAIGLGNIEYLVDLRSGQKTGCYLDQQTNRLAVAALAKERRVLDLYCYAGGFGLEAAKAGAKSVIGVDSSEPALSLARANVELNQLTGVEFVEADAIEFLQQAPTHSSDLIILDPPRFATNRLDVERALRKYFRLNLEALRVLEPGGILVSCSCSGLVTPDEFLGMLSSVARRAQRRLQFLEIRGAREDHPVISSCPETNYLKVVIARAV